MGMKLGRCNHRNRGTSQRDATYSNWQQTASYNSNWQRYCIPYFESIICRRSCQCSKKPEPRKGWSQIHTRNYTHQGLESYPRSKQHPCSCSSPGQDLEGRTHIKVYIQEWVWFFNAESLNITKNKFSFWLYFISRNIEMRMLLERHSQWGSWHGKHIGPSCSVDPRTRIGWCLVSTTAL